jgi:hypothetical protein
LKLLDELLPPAQRSHSFIVVSHVDMQVVKGGYRERLDISWAQWLILIQNNANNVDFFIDMVQYVCPNYVRFENNLA